MVTLILNVLNRLRCPSCPLCIFILFCVNVSGTTAATVLTRAIFAEGCKSVAAGMNAMDLRRGINLAVDAVVAHLKSRARQISTSEEIAQVCHFLLCTG